MCNLQLRTSAGQGATLIVDALKPITPREFNTMLKGTSVTRAENKKLGVSRQHITERFGPFPLFFRENRISFHDDCTSRHIHCSLAAYGC